VSGRNIEPVVRAEFCARPVCRERFYNVEGRIETSDFQRVHEPSVRRARTIGDTRCRFQRQKTVAGQARGPRPQPRTRGTVKDVGNLAQQSPIRTCAAKVRDMEAMFERLSPIPRRLGRGALDLLFPPLCIICRETVREPHSLCSDCWQQIGFLDGPSCSCCGLPFEIDPGAGTLCATCHARPPAFDRARSVMRYDEFSRTPILALKHSDRHDVAPAFARWMMRTGSALIADADVIVPVPLHRRRLWSRRYNHSALLARALAKLSNKGFDPLSLIRIRGTPSQGEMPSAKARRRNVRGAFKVADARIDRIAGNRVLLIDDVLTTGATVDACARALKRAGAAKVDILTLARVVRPL
jgi:ComF family protein